MSCATSTFGSTTVRSLIRFPFLSADTNSVLCGMVVWRQSRCVEPLRQKASRYQMSTLPPGISGPEMLSMLLVQARVRPAVLAAVREQIPANRSGTKKTHLRMHWDHEPTPDPSQEGSSIDRTAPRLGGVSGGFVADWFME